MLIRQFKKTIHRAAFTLIELLVVICIIMILAAMLVPMANKVQGISGQIHCASNMRSIYASILAYASDNNGFYPITPGVGESGNPSYAYWMLTSATAQIDYRNGQLWKYLDPGVAKFSTTNLTSSARYRLFNCPADEEALRLSRKGTLALAPRNFTYSFNIEMRQHPLGGGAWRTGVRVAEVAMASQKIITVEEQWPNDGLAFLGWVDQGVGPYSTSPGLNRDADDVMSARHNGMANQGFADGHVELIDPRTLGFNIYNIQYGTTSGPTNTSSLVGAKALDLFYH